MGKTFIVRETIKCPCGKVLQVEIPVVVYGQHVTLQRSDEESTVTEVKQDG